MCAPRLRLPSKRIRRSVIGGLDSGPLLSAKSGSWVERTRRTVCLNMCPVVDVAGAHEIAQALAYRMWGCSYSERQGARPGWPGSARSLERVRRLQPGVVPWRWQRRVLDHVLREQCALEPNGNVVLLLSGDDRTGPGGRRSSFKRGRSGDPACPSSRLVRILMTCEPLDRGLSAVGLLVGPIGLLVSEGHIQ